MDIENKYQNGDVFCRIGSSEKYKRTRAVISSVFCRIGSSEIIAEGLMLF